MVDLDDIRSRYQHGKNFLDERGRRLFAANEALTHGYGGVTATSAATGIARSTVARGIAELRSERNDTGHRVRRPGGGRKSAVVHQPDLPAAAIEDAIRGDPCSPLRWVNRSLCQLVKALAAKGIPGQPARGSQPAVRTEYNCQANSKTREGANRPDRDAQFARINATVKAAIASGQPAVSVDTKNKEPLGDFKNTGRELRRQDDPEKVRMHDFKILELGKVASYGVDDIAANHGRGLCRHQRRYRRLCGREYLALVAEDWCNPAGVDGRLWRQQLIPLIIRRRRGLTSAIGSSCLVRVGSDNPSLSDRGPLVEVSRQQLPRSGFVQCAASNRSSAQSIHSRLVGRILPLMVQHHPNGALAHLKQNLVRRLVRHDPFCQQLGPLANPGRFTPNPIISQRSRYAPRAS
jgi:hypothetical protein